MQVECCFCSASVRISKKQEPVACKCLPVRLSFAFLPAQVFCSCGEPRSASPPPPPHPSHTYPILSRQSSFRCAGLMHIGAAGSHELTNSAHNCAPSSPNFPLGGTRDAICKHQCLISRSFWFQGMPITTQIWDPQHGVAIHINESQCGRFHYVLMEAV